MDVFTSWMKVVVFSEASTLVPLESEQAFNDIRKVRDGGLGFRIRNTEREAGLEGETCEPGDGVQSAEGTLFRGCLCIVFSSL